MLISFFVITTNLFLSLRNSLVVQANDIGVVILSYYALLR